MFGASSAGKWGKNLSKKGKNPAIRERKSSGRHRFANCALKASGHASGNMGPKAGQATED